LKQFSSRGNRLLLQGHVTVLRSTTPVDAQAVRTHCMSAAYSNLSKSTVIWRLTEEGGRFVLTFVLTHRS